MDSLRRVFAPADELRMAIIIHMRPSRQYGAKDAMVFMREVLPGVRHVPVQIAHMAGYGNTMRLPTRRSSRLRRPAPIPRQYVSTCTFDVLAMVVRPDAEYAPYGTAARMTYEILRGYTQWPTQLPMRIRQLGIKRILFATDWPAYSPDEYRSVLVERLSLQPAELQQIFRNLAPFLK